ncbi:MAG: hypothetical protein GTO14_24070, partial [Anaerolineales bacterium]|nr:hypothetical protein [Anaerolineales bacterium]
MAPKKDADETRREVRYTWHGADFDAELYLFGLTGETFPTSGRLRFLFGLDNRASVQIDDPHDLVEIRDML